MVDRILASHYADVPHDVAHLTITPFQKFSALMEWIFGNENGLPIYIGSANQLSTFILPNGKYSSY